MRNKEGFKDVGMGRIRGVPYTSFNFTDLHLFEFDPKTFGCIVCFLFPIIPIDPHA